MKQDALKWLLVTAVIIGAAAYFVLSEKDFFGIGTQSSGEVVAVQGNSRAFDIEPVEGIRISAPENALDRDREFKLTAVSDKVFDRTAKILEHEGVKPLMVFDLDAGLKPEEHLPGDYNMVLDLNKLGIPPSLHDHVCVFRLTNSQKDAEYYRYVTKLSGGKLSLRSNQNSIFFVALVTAGSITVGVQVVRRIFEYTAAAGRNMPGGRSVQDYFNYGFDSSSISIPIPDENGDFVITFRFSDTENPTGRQAYMENEKAFFKRYEELEQQAKKMYEKNRVKYSSKQEQAKNDNIGVQEILKSLIPKDSIMARINADPAGQLPQSVQRHIEQIKKANKYLNDIGLHPFDYELPVYLVGDQVLTESVNGVARKYIGVGSAFLLINYTLSRLDTETRWEQRQCTIVHELFHARQQSYYAYVYMNSAPAESTAAVLDHDAAIGWHKSRYFQEDATTITGCKNVCTDRDLCYLYAFPLDKAIGKVSADEQVDASYALSHVIESVRKSAKKENVTMRNFADSYHSYGPHALGWKGWIMKSLEIDEAAFDKGWNYFGSLYLQSIYASQGGAKVPADAKKIDVDITEKEAVVKLKKLSTLEDYSVTTYHFDLPSVRIPGEGNITKNGNLLILCKEKGTMKDAKDPYMTIYLSDKSFAECTGEDDRRKPATPSMHSATGNTSYQLAAVGGHRTLGEAYDYYAVVFLAPEAPEIRKVKEDQVSFIMPKPSRSLSKHKFITGGVVTYVDKDGHKETHVVSPKLFGKKIKWTIPGATRTGNSFSLSLHWFYQPDEKTTYESPESEKATWGVMKEEKADEVTSGYKPETNYWKRVSIRGNMVTSGKVEEKLDGVDFVNPDYRFVEMKQQDMGSFEIEGWAAVNTSKDERIYERTLSLDGELSMTAPPEFWVPGAEYAGVWSMEQDPYVAKIGDPFGFKAEITTTSDKACTASRKAKTDTGRSNHGGSPWIRKYTGTFMARFPEGDAPRAFSLTQTFEVAERPGSDRKALVTYIYDYEWVGEPEEEVEEEPDGSYWKLVKVYEDDTKAKYENRGKGDWYQLFDITGGGSRFNLKIEQTKYGNSGSVSQSASIVAPKQIYHPGESVAFDHTLGEPTITGHSFNGGAADIYVLTLRRVLTNKQYKLGERGNEGIGGAFVSRQYPNPDLSSMIVPAHDEWFNTFTIVDRARAGAGATEVWHSTVYEYQWVEAGQKPKQENVSGGHWKLSNTVVSNEPGMMNGGSDIVTVQGGNGNYNAHVERDGDISDREIRFDKPKTVYRPGEQITLNITNDKAKTKNTKDGIVYGVVDFSTAQPGQSTDYPAMDKHPGYNSGKVKGTATGVAPQSGKAGVVDFSITEQIMVKGSYTKTHTTYYYEWVE